MAAVEPIAEESVLRLILQQFVSVENYLNNELMAVLQRGPEWYREEARLRRLHSAARAQMGELRAALDRPTIARGLGQFYAAGATEVQGVVGERFEWGQAHLGAVERIATDTYDDLLKATTYVTDATKTLIRDAGKIAAGRKVIGGQTAVQAGNKLARSLRESGIGVVTYRNGARHGVGEYARMLMRTKTAVAYNVGTLNHAGAAGIEFFEIGDGIDCGLSYHFDPTIANGMIVDAKTAAAFPISHPNCVRSFAPRPDILAKDPNAQVYDFTPTKDQRKDQAAFERFMRAQKKEKTGRARQAAQARARREAEQQQRAIERVRRANARLKAQRDAGDARALRALDREAQAVRKAQEAALRRSGAPAGVAERAPTPAPGVGADAAQRVRDAEAKLRQAEVRLKDAFDAERNAQGGVRIVKGEYVDTRLRAANDARARAQVVLREARRDLRVAPRSSDLDARLAENARRRREAREFEERKIRERAEREAAERAARGPTVIPVPNVESVERRLAQLNPIEKVPKGAQAAFKAEQAARAKLGVVDIEWQNAVNAWEHKWIQLGRPGADDAALADPDLVRLLKERQVWERRLVAERKKVAAAEDRLQAAANKVAYRERQAQFKKEKAEYDKAQKKIADRNAKIERDPNVIAEKEAKRLADEHFERVNKEFVDKLEEVNWNQNAVPEALKNRYMGAQRMQMDAEARLNRARNEVVQKENIREARNARAVERRLEAKRAEARRAQDREAVAEAVEADPRVVRAVNRAAVEQNKADDLARELRARWEAKGRPDIDADAELRALRHEQQMAQNEAGRLRGTAQAHREGVSDEYVARLAEERKIAEAGQPFKTRPVVEEYTGPDEGLKDFIDRHYSSHGGQGGISEGGFFSNPNTGERYYVKQGGGDRIPGPGRGIHEATHEMMSARVLDKVDIPHSPVRLASKDPGGHRPGDNWIAVSHIENQPGVSHARQWADEPNFRGGVAEQEDAVRISLFDQIAQNQDGHGGNFMHADVNGEHRLVPIDNSLILGGRGGGVSGTDAQFFPEPQAMTFYDQPGSSQRRGLFRKEFRYGNTSLTPRQIEAVYDETVDQLRAGVESMRDTEWLAQFSSAERAYVQLQADYLRRQLDGLVTYRDTNIQWFMGG